MTVDEIRDILIDHLSSTPAASAAVVRGETSASIAFRGAISEEGQLSLSGLERYARTHVWTLYSEFSPRIGIGDVLMIDDTPSFVVDSRTTCGNFINRARVVLCEDTVTINDQEVKCQLGGMTQDADMDLGGTRPDDFQGFYIPESIIPESVEISISTPVLISGSQLLVEKISRDAKYGILCVTCRKRGAA